ncbi:MAG: hypothetical protein V4726_02515 [Verrucomicrobiota bacterium]
MTFKTDPADALTRGTVFKAVARLRFAEAEVLQHQKHLLGAVYLVGYAIECHLKYAVCATNEFLLLPSFACLSDGKLRKLYTHEWDVLVAAAQLRPSFKAEPRMEAIYTSLALTWAPSLRYRTKPFEESEGRRLYRSLAALYQFLKISQP